MLPRKVVVATLCLSTPTLGFIVMGHHNTLARIDPLVNPGVIGNHVHAVVGGSAFDINYDADKYKNAACTSVETPADKSNYWMPAVYGYRDGVFSALPVREVRIYYFTEGSVAFPDGFRMLAGSPNSRAPDTDCCSMYCQQGSHAGTSSEARSVEWPAERCWDFLRTEITFPNCWTGDTSIEDTTGQTSYPGPGGVCPDTHPIKHPKIILEFGYNSSDYDPKSFVFANGDTTGYGLHGDFAMGWDRDLLQALIDDDANCNARQNPFGEEGSGCNVLVGHLDRESAYTCTMSANIPQEEVGIARPITALPGCNLLWSDTSSKPTCDSTVDVAFGPATQVFQSYGASYAGFMPGQLPIYEGDTIASTGGTTGSGTNTTAAGAGSNNATGAASTPKASTSTGAVPAAATTAGSSNAGTSGSSSTTSSSDSGSSSSSLTSNPILLVALGAGAMLLIGVGIYIFISQRNKSTAKAAQDKAKAVEEGRRLQKSEDETSSGSGSEASDDEGVGSGSDTAVKK